MCKFAFALSLNIFDVIEQKGVWDFGGFWVSLDPRVEKEERFSSGVFEQIA